MIETRILCRRSIIGEFILRAEPAPLLGGRLRQARIGRRFGPLRVMVRRITRIGGGRCGRRRRLFRVARNVRERIALSDQARQFGERIAAIGRLGVAGAGRRLTLEFGPALGPVEMIVRHVRFCDLCFVQNRFVGV